MAGRGGEAGVDAMINYVQIVDDCCESPKITTTCKSLTSGGEEYTTRCENCGDESVSTLTYTDSTKGGTWAAATYTEYPE
jgi:hypothetical protein